MKLEYLYNNNNNLKCSIKRSSIFGVVLILVSLLMLYLMEGNNFTDFNIFIIIMSIVMSIVLSNIIFLIVFSLYNNFNKKQFINIKNNGTSLKGIILMANEHYQFHIHSWLNKSSGDIDYNDEFKLLEKSLTNNYTQLHRNQIEVNIYVLDNKAIADLDSIHINYNV